MIIQDLVVKIALEFKVTTNSNHQLTGASNLLEQQFEATGPNQEKVGDNTYLMTSEEGYYLFYQALTMELFCRGRPKDAIVRSDRGSQYYSNVYMKNTNIFKVYERLSLLL